MDGLLDFFSREAGQRRRAALDEFGRDVGYYVPPELRGLLGLAAEMTPSATIDRAAQAGGEMMAPGQTPMERVGSAGRMLSETAGVAAPMMVAGRAAMPAAQALQEGLLGFSMAGQGAADAGRRFLADEAGTLLPGNTADDMERALRDKYPGLDVSIGGNASRGYTVNKIIAPEQGQGIGARAMQDITDTADAQGAIVSLTPSSDFGGNKSRLKDFYKRLGFVENKGRDKDLSISDDMYRAPQSPQSPAQNIAKLLREGRADEVTDDMLGALTSNDNMELFDLYQRGETGMDLPMDEASRMARAREMGFDGEFYHGTQDGSFPSFRTSPHDEIDLTGVSVTPDAAEANWYAANRPDFNPGMDRGDPAVLPVATRGQYGDETDILFAPEDMPTADIVSGMDGVDFQQFNERYVFNPANIRSRFARFDPRLAHLRNLSAGVAGAGLLATQQTEQEREDEIRQYLGGLL